tara:strand:- start:1015 stop:1608 length:594 start_codon:yes stop_codon:yes gene_type:complete
MRFYFLISFLLIISGFIFAQIWVGVYDITGQVKTLTSILTVAIALSALHIWKRQESLRWVNDVEAAFYRLYADVCDDCHNLIMIEKYEKSSVQESQQRLREYSRARLRSERDRLQSYSDYKVKFLLAKKILKRARGINLEEYPFIDPDSIRIEMYNLKKLTIRIYESDDDALLRHDEKQRLWWSNYNTSIDSVRNEI